ncbi:hypothetical protein MFRU_012g01210 [Monilinia fructicola]|uniref:O-methyltransferase C-terminal domain-containing protein n=1 Tax=Monilinia fructicola TaxID=38448 RepID=A0A5M9JLF2_MONFR|nr:hypothetical protein EYC84_007593 [Monilinia fructicola]KAG4030383.1 hypothetical protein MFRU_012g01210 [Monilinia fructicola]
MASPSQLIVLSNTISEGTAIVNEYFLSHNLPMPSFDVSGPPRVVIPSHEKRVAAAYAEVLRATIELHNLLLGPTAILMSSSVMDSMSLHFIYAYDMANTFPVDEEATYEQISEKCGLNVVDTRRVLGYAMTNHMFKEVRPGVVAHTAASKLLATNPLIKDYVGIASEERFQAAAHTVEALQTYGIAKEPNETGYSIGHRTTKGLYEELSAHPSRGKRFANAMSAINSGNDPTSLFETYDWKSLGSATMIDVGGGYGYISISLATKFPSLKFIVQDVAGTVADGSANVPAEVSDRVSFMAYDMLNPQTLRNIDVLFFRAIFHNWTDHYCIKILRNQIPALKKGSRLIIVEPLLVESGQLPWHEEKRLRSINLNMLSYFGSREKSIDDWREIFREADERFKVESAVRLGDTLTYIMEVLWTGD